MAPAGLRVEKSLFIPFEEILEGMHLEDNAPRAWASEPRPIHPLGPWGSRPCPAGTRSPGQMHRLMTKAGTWLPEDSCYLAPSVPVAYSWNSRIHVFWDCRHFESGERIRVIHTERNHPQSSTCSLHGDWEWHEIATAYPVPMSRIQVGIEPGVHNYL